MKKILVMLTVLAAAFSLAQGADCPEANYDACVSDGYAIVETEPDTYWPHNEMAAAHWTGAKHHVSGATRHHRARHHHRKHRHHRTHRCHCSCR